MATGIGRGKMQLAAFDGSFLKTLYMHRNLLVSFYANRVIANFVSNFATMATGVGRRRLQLAAFDGEFLKTPL